VAADELLAQSAVADTEQHADALRRLEREVEPGDWSVGHRAPEQCAGRRIMAGEEPFNPAVVDVAGQSETACALPAHVPGASPSPSPS
jgi:hypothetical protein